MTPVQPRRFHSFVECALCFLKPQAYAVSRKGLAVSDIVDLRREIELLATLVRRLADQNEKLQGEIRELAGTVRTLAGEVSHVGEELRKRP